MGWQTSLSLTRWRPVGQVDFTADDRLIGPWGPMSRGIDGAWYADGFTSLVRIVDTDNTFAGPGHRFTAYLPDGRVAVFATQAPAPAGLHSYAWWLTNVTDALGRRTDLDYLQQAGSRTVLSSVRYGGIVADSGRIHQPYTIAFGYEPANLSHGEFTVVDYRSGAAVRTDRRVKSIAISYQGSIHWSYNLAYAQNLHSPAAFYLSTVTKVFASGESLPPQVYKYDVSQAALDLGTSRHADGPGSLWNWLQQQDVVGSAWTNGEIIESATTASGADNLELALLRPANPLWITIDGTGTGTTAPFDYPTQAEWDNLFYASPVPSACSGQGCNGAEVAILSSDVITTTNGARVLEFFHMPSGGAWVKQEVPIQGTITAGPVFADVNNDHKPDLVYISTASGTDILSIFFNKSPRDENPNFGSSYQVPLGHAQTYSTLQVVDLNGDGLQDIVYSTAGTSVLNALTQVGCADLFCGAGFQENAAITDTNGNATSIPSGDTFQFFDANNDGLTDMLIVDPSLFTGAAPRLFLNQGHQSTGAAVGVVFGERAVPGFVAAWSSLTQPTPNYPPSVFVADLTGKGDIHVNFNSDAQLLDMQLTSPGVGLLTSVDDSLGNVTCFVYSRAPAEPLTYKRPIVVQDITRTATGEPTLDSTFMFSGRVVHSQGLYTLGFQNVQRQRPSPAKVTALIPR